MRPISTMQEEKILPADHDFHGGAGDDFICLKRVK